MNASQVGGTGPIGDLLTVSRQVLGDSVVCVRARGEIDIASSPKLVQDGAMRWERRSWSVPSTGFAGCWTC